MTDLPDPRAPDLRAAAARTIAAVVQRGQSLSTALPTQAHTVAARDRPVLHELCYGTLRWYPR
ncbi:MAG: 16S rRNA (cytosine(967)-C(5))-methyltransferase, partial [Porticoccaceae bacterium]